MNSRVSPAEAEIGNYINRQLVCVQVMEAEKWRTGRADGFNINLWNTKC